MTTTKKEFFFWERPWRRQRRWVNERKQQSRGRTVNYRKSDTSTYRCFWLYLWAFANERMRSKIHTCMCVCVFIASRCQEYNMSHDGSLKVHRARHSNMFRKFDFEISYLGQSVSFVSVGVQSLASTEDKWIAFQQECENKKIYRNQCETNQKMIFFHSMCCDNGTRYKINANNAVS